MGRLSSKLRSIEGGGVLFWCPGCNSAHTVKVDGPESWGWNRDVDRPTFNPSVHVTSGHYARVQSDGDGCWCRYYEAHPLDERLFNCVSCHSFVEDGHIRFLDDCSHALVGQTVPLPDYPTGDNA